MKTNFNIKITSGSLYFLILLISLLIGIIGPTYLLSISRYKFSTGFYCLIDLTVGFSLIFLLKPISKKKAIITINDELLRVNFNDSFIFFNKRIVEIPWNELDRFSIEPNKHLTKVRFKLINGKKVVLFHDTNDSKQDDYRSFEIAVYNKIININKHQSKSIAL